MSSDQALHINELGFEESDQQYHRLLVAMDIVLQIHI